MARGGRPRPVADAPAKTMIQFSTQIPILLKTKDLVKYRVGQLGKCPVCNKLFRLTKRREKFCSQECSHKRDRSEDRTPVNKAQEPETKQVIFPKESALVERIIPGLPSQTKEPLVWFVVTLRQLGYEIVKNETEKDLTNEQ